MNEKYLGVKVRLADGKDYIVPRLPHAVFMEIGEKHKRTIDTLRQTGEAPLAEHVEFILDVAFAALTLNYPQLTREEVWALIGDLIQEQAGFDLMKAAWEECR